MIYQNKLTNVGHSEDELKKYPIPTQVKQYYAGKINFGDINVANEELKQLFKSELELYGNEYNVP